MAGKTPFEEHSAHYEAWFERHEAAYVSELLALRYFVPLKGDGLEIGVGSGRFAAPLGIGSGLDPSSAMLARAHERGVNVYQGVAERLPFADQCFDHALVMMTLCFVDSPPAMLAEARRVLKPGGVLVIGFIDRESALGRQYEIHRRQSTFYRDARFHSTDEVEHLLREAGFSIEAWGQTLSQPLEQGKIEALRPDRGDGAFVVVRACNG